MHERTKDQCPLYRELLQVNEKKQTFQLKKLAAPRRNANDHEKGTEKHSGTCRDLSFNSKKIPTTSAWTRLGGRGRYGIPFAIAGASMSKQGLGECILAKPIRCLRYLSLCKRCCQGSAHVLWTLHFGGLLLTSSCQHLFPEPSINMVGRKC